MKIKSLKLKTAILFIFSLLMVFLDNKAYSQSKIDCSKATTQIEINACLQNKYDIENKELNDLYKKVSIKLNIQQRAALIQSQRKWIDFRDEYSKIYGLVYNGGSIAISEVLNCKIQTTQARIAELQTLFDQLNR